MSGAVSRVSASCGKHLPYLYWMHRVEKNTILGFPLAGFQFWSNFADCASCQTALMLAAKLVLYIQREHTREFPPTPTVASCRLRIQHQLLFPFTLSCAAYFCRPGTRKPENHVTRTRGVVRENSSDRQEQRTVTSIFVGHTEYSSLEAALIKITRCFGVPV